MTAPSFSAVFERYRHHLQADLGLRPSTVKQVRKVLYDWNGYLTSLKRPKRWDQAGPKDLQGFLDRPAPRARGGTGRRAPNTRSGYANIVLVFYKRIYAWQMLGRDRMRGFIPPRPSRPVPRALDLPDVHKALEAAAGDLRMSTLLWLAYGAGMRVSEIAKARVEHVRLKADPPMLQIPDGKGGKARVVPLAPPVVAVLRRVIDQRGTVGPLVESLRAPGSPVLPHTVSILLSKHLHACGINESGHSLRHAFATELLKSAKGANLYSVSRALGHASTEITETTYVSGYLGDLAGLAASLPDPRAGNSLRHGGSNSEPTGLAALVPVDVRDQLAAAVATLECHGPEVARAAETLAKMTTKAWLATLGLSEPSQLASLHAGDPRLDHTDQEWAECEAALKIDVGWRLAYELRDAIDD